MDIDALLRGTVTSTTLLDAIIYSVIYSINPIAEFVTTSTQPAFVTTSEQTDFVLVLQ